MFFYLIWSFGHFLIWLDIIFPGAVAGRLQAPVSIKNIDFEKSQPNPDPARTFFHLFVSPAEATPGAFTARLSNALVIYCISLCISSSSSFQPSLFIHFHLKFDPTQPILR